MQLKDVIESPCGLRFMFDALDVQSGFSRRLLLDSTMMTNGDEIASCYDRLSRFVDFTTRTDNTYIDTLKHKLCGLKDIRTTIANLSKGATLDDIELFEIKHLAMLSADVNKLMRQHNMDEVVPVPDLSDVIDVLDPDGLKIATFYIYDAYSDELKTLRIQMRQSPDRQDELLLQADELEAVIRAELSDRLQPRAQAIACAQTALAQIDVLLAKALQVRQLNLCLPAVSTHGTSRYQAIFHPQVQAALTASGRDFQPVDISFGTEPTLITGANMGGKTVVLKTLALCQWLFQFGFGVPAATACIAIKDEIHFCIGDEQSIEKGLSSFAAEMKNIDAVIKASRTNKQLLALIDEPARTTNPAEGAALVSALLAILDKKSVSLVMTTHYDINSGTAHCLKVKGLEDGRMDYSLIDVNHGEVPQEALNIAQSLGIDRQWIDMARAMLSDNVTRNNEL